MPCRTNTTARQLWIRTGAQSSPFAAEPIVHAPTPARCSVSSAISVEACWLLEAEATLVRSSSNAVGSASGDALVTEAPVCGLPGASLVVALADSSIMLRKADVVILLAKDGRSIGNLTTTPVRDGEEDPKFPRLATRD